MDTPPGVAALPRAGVRPQAPRGGALPAQPAVRACTRAAHPQDGGRAVRAEGEPRSAGERALHPAADAGPPAAARAAHGRGRRRLAAAPRVGGPPGHGVRPQAPRRAAVLQPPAGARAAPSCCGDEGGVGTRSREISSD